MILHYDKVDMLNGAQKSVNYTTTVKKNFFVFCNLPLSRASMKKYKMASLKTLKGAATP